MLSLNTKFYKNKEFDIDDKHNTIDFLTKSFTNEDQLDCETNDWEDIDNYNSNLTKPISYQILEKDEWNNSFDFFDVPESLNMNEKNSDISLKSNSKVNFLYFNN